MKTDRSFELVPGRKPHILKVKAHWKEKGWDVVQIVYEIHKLSSGWVMCSGLNWEPIEVFTGESELMKFLQSKCGEFVE